MMEYIRERGFVSLSELVEKLGCSESTVRRDLEYWDNLGVIKRTHGGAFYTQNEAMPAFDERTATMLPEKRRIARYAASLIQPGDTVLLDGGTTTFEVAKCLFGKRIHLVTNSLPVAQIFAARPDVDLVLLGGYVFPRTGVALGPLTVKMLQDIHVHKAILSVGGLTAKGLFNSNLLLVETERQMIRSADQVIIVADHSKIGRQAVAFLCDWSSVDLLITDDDLTGEQAELLSNVGVHFVFVGESDVFDSQAEEVGA
ncbi:MAG: DeoR/GlpR family DNA-binding transcription regulator [Gemmatales bacterium]|nr:DeoR/GlpR family DNA-binding transcription regulator [Gemmatales bacterium]